MIVVNGRGGDLRRLAPQEGVLESEPSTDGEPAEAQSFIFEGNSRSKLQSNIAFCTSNQGVCIGRAALNFDT